ncbi:hypothetical protein B0H11DRAFT_2265961 [Mycena galericulata]|nr:hypothetical protein B0H11DRAFT_2265961 [Mycena galericulata]
MTSSYGLSSLLLRDHHLGLILTIIAVTHSPVPGSIKERQESLIADNSTRWNLPQHVVLVFLCLFLPKPSPTLHIPAALPTPAVPQTHDISTSTNAASTVVTLDLGYPIRILLWTNADSAPELLSNLYAGTDKKFRLNEYRTLLRVKGFRDDRPFELYMKSQEVWRAWDLDECC